MNDLTVLVVDDEIILRKTLRTYLEDEGFAVETASSGAEALEIVKKCQVDIMIVDMHLPDMGGESVIESARGMNAALKFIVHTGDTGFTVSPALARAGVTERNILFKPILDLNSINRVIRNAAGH